jgi:phenylacetate-CoA ligase
MDVMEIYNNSPIFLQNIYTSLEGLKYKRSRYGEYYNNYLDFYRNFDDKDSELMEKYQNDEVKKIVNYAYNNSEFYQDYYKGIDISKINGVNDLKRLPILPKETVRKNISSMYTLNEKDAIKSNTSGTTGKSMLFLFTKNGFQQRMAILDHFKEKHGFINGEMKKATFNSSKIVPSKQTKKIFWRDNIFLKQRIYSGYHCQGDNIKYYVDNLNKYKPDSLDGYPSSLYEVAKYIVENKIKLDFKPVAIFPTAEILLPKYKKKIEQAFNCKVYDQYSSSEGAPFITECEFGNLHYNKFSGVIEMNEDNEMLVTCFSTYGTPLIRYKIGDKAIFDTSSKRCNCGSAHPLVKQIEGRSLDYLQSKSNGKITSVYLSLVSEEFANSVIAMQFIQNSLNQIDINIAVDSSYDSKMDEIILNKLYYSLGKDMKYVIHKMKEIPKEPSGKFRLVINNYSNN